MMRSSSRGSSPRSKPPRAAVAIGAAVALLVAAWLLWPSARVKNRDALGSNVIAFGDSLTAGYGAGPGEDYPSRLAALLGREIVNAGVSGDTTEQALARIDDDVLARDPKLVIVGLGGNDFLSSVPIQTTEANLRSIVRKIHDRGAMVLLLGFRFPSLQNNYESMYARIAKEEGCALLPDLLDGILSDPKLKSDEIHPNANGYAIIAERIAPPAKKLLQ
jgi:lysophospholipase L1-like esterase